MRKSLLLSTSITALTLGVFGASAEESVWSNRYVSLFGAYSNGLNSPFILDDYLYDTDFKGGFTVGGAYGFYLTPSLRGEIEGSYQRYASGSYTYVGNVPSDRAKGHVDSWTVMLNVWKDIDVGTSFTPYVGGGAGVSYGSMSIDWSTELSEGSNFGFATQLGAGVRMDMSERTKLDIGYRLRSIHGLVAANEEDASDITLANYLSHSLQVGFTYMLGDDYGNMEELPGADSDVYYTLFAGVALPQDSSFVTSTYTYEVNNKTGFTTGAAVGTSLLPGLRGELEVAYSRYANRDNTYQANQSHESMSGAVGLYTLTANIWKDIPVGKYTTYVGGGLGFGIVDTEGTLDDDSYDGAGLGLALQFGAGIRKPVTEDWAIDIGYRAKGVYGAIIHGVGDNDHSKGSFLSHMLQVGFTYGDGMFDMPETEELLSQGHYVSLFGGVALHEGSGFAYDDSTYEMNYATGFTIGAALGTQISDTVRGELELSYQYADVCGARDESDTTKCDDTDWAGKQQSVNLLANVWKDFDTGVISPYIGGGIGLALVLPDIDEWADPDVALAAQVGGGLRYAVKEDLTLDLGYRFKGVFDTQTTGHLESGADDEHGMHTYYTHAVTGGLTWDF